jgi:hypothetical protein
MVAMRGEGEQRRGESEWPKNHAAHTHPASILSSTCMRSSPYAFRRLCVGEPGTIESGEMLATSQYKSAIWQIIQPHGMSTHTRHPYDARAK